MDNPCAAWLADSSWDNVTEMDKLPNFHGIMSSFEQYPRDWNLWFTSTEPEKAPLPGLLWQNVFVCSVPVPAQNVCFTLSLLSLFLGDWDNNCNDLQKMLVVRSLRQDRVSFCVTSFIIDNLGIHFVEPPVLDMKAVSRNRHLCLEFCSVECCVFHISSILVLARLKTTQSHSFCTLSRLWKNLPAGLL